MMTAPEAGRLDALRRRLTPERIESIAIGVFVLFVVWPFLHRGRMVISFDGLAYSGPNLQVTLDAIKSGELPLWNRFIFGGVTHAGNPQTGFWYPLTLLGLPFSTTRAINVLTLAHLLLFAGGMIALCRWQLRLRPPATFVGTVVALGCGAIATKTIQFEQLLVVAWVPLLLALLHWLVAADRPWRAAGCTALATGAWLSAGHPQTHYLIAPLLVVWTLGLVLDHESSDRLVHAAGAAIAGAVIALPHLMLALRATDASALGAGRTLDDIRSLGWLQGRSIVPGLLGNPTSLNHAFLTHDFESTTYVGAAAAVLAIVGLITGIARRYRRYTSLGLGLLAVLCLTLAVGPVTAVFRFAFDVVPGFDLGRVAARWVLPASLCLSVLAAWGVEAARDADRRQRIAALVAVVVFGIGAALAAMAYPEEVPGRRVAAVWVIVAAVTAVAWALRPSTDGLDPATAASRGTPGPLWRVALAACAVVPAVLVGGELSIAARHSFARGVTSAHAPETATGEALAFLESNPEGRTLAFTFDELGNSEYLPPALRPNVNATLGIPSIDGYDGGVQITKRWAAVFGALIRDFNMELTLRAQITEPLDPATWARLDVRYVLIDIRGTGAELLPAWRQVLVTDGFAVYENLSWKGDAVATFATMPVGSVEEAGRALSAATAMNVVAVETADEALACNLADCTPVGMPIERRSPSNLVVRTDLAAPAVVSVAEQPDEGWHVTVDGEPADVLAVDGVRIGVAVPAGAHEVHFTFRPDDLTLSMGISLLATLVALVFAIAPIRRGGALWQRLEQFRTTISRRPSS
jgi:hypothetical protein